MTNWNKTITLYNKYEDEQTGLIKWYRHKLQHCFYKVTNNKVNIGNIQISTNDNIIRIPKQNVYVSPDKWLALSDTLKGQCMTLQGGDLIFFGNITDEIDEYTAGQRSSDIIAKYKVSGSVFITSVNINTDLPGAHYLVRGE